jgi:hypothetical protein
LRRRPARSCSQIARFWLSGQNGSEARKKIQTMLASISRYNHTRIIGKRENAMVLKALAEFQKAVGI